MLHITCLLDKIKIYLTAMISQEYESSQSIDSKKFHPIAKTVQDSSQNISSSTSFFGLVRKSWHSLNFQEENQSFYFTKVEKKLVPSASTTN